MAAVSLAASYGKPSGDGWQAADLQYYSSGAVYTLLTFYQMWPVKAITRMQRLSGALT